MRPTYINTRTKRKSINKRFAGVSGKNSLPNRKLQKGLFGYSQNGVLQFMTLTVIACFGALLIPNLLSADAPKANAQENKKIQIISNFAATNNNSSQVSQLVEVSQNLETTNSSSSSSAKIIANPSFAASTKTYKVTSGETIASIATKLNLDPVELAIINGLKNSKVEVGMELKLP